MFVTVSHFHPKYRSSAFPANIRLGQGILTKGEGGGRLSTIDLLIKVPCFVKEVNNIFNIKKCWLVKGGQPY